MKNNVKIIKIRHMRPYVNMSNEFLNHIKNVSKLVYESDEAPIAMRAHALDTSCDIELELAARN
jgi:hypothetical protein